MNIHFVLDYRLNSKLCSILYYSVSILIEDDDPYSDGSTISYWDTNSYTSEIVSTSTTSSITGANSAIAVDDGVFSESEHEYDLVESNVSS